MAKYVSEFSKRWDVRVPRSAISWLVNRLHVSVTEDAIAADIRARCAVRPEWTEALIKQAIAYALECHNRNREIWRRCA